MVQINLLPWRERAREIKKKNFFTTLAACIGFALFIIFLLHLYYQDIISFQDKRNSYLQSQIAQKQAEIDNLRKDRDQQAVIEAKLQDIMALREKSYRAVNLLNVLLRIVPESITLNKLVLDGNAVTLEGRAQTELAITAFLKSISDEPLFNQPVLTGINSQEGKNANIERFFQIKVDLKIVAKKPVEKNKTGDSHGN